MYTYIYIYTYYHCHILLIILKANMTKPGAVPIQGRIAFAAFGLVIGKALAILAPLQHLGSTGLEDAHRGQVEQKEYRGIFELCG